MHLTDPLTLLFFVLGLVLGSFGNVLIERLPKNKKVSGRSKCPECKKQISNVDLIPVLSYILLQGKCRNCSEKISIQYPLVELGSGILFVIALLITPASVFSAIFLAVILWLMLIMSVIDFKTHTIPDALNISFVILAILYSYVTGYIPILAPLIAAGFFFAQWRISAGKWVGSGDIILAAGIGFLLGNWEYVLVMLGVSYIAGSLVALPLLLFKKKGKKEHLAFGPFLAIGTLVVLIWGDQILRILI
ncbi:MAG: prepilin peptidase [Candidatus Peribacteraceae bacterium]|jgi:leader peptidase (prepilin peptidase)/N-methyltransferase|nr:prepilin peptidase [Candidatus Peribacteraceae bacterium]HCI04341.1 hypothetical protein [Candidatus Peribacteria bacterium]|tara:strand:+ start:12258 stop:13001 length:744 start_codon:yes stop_codon:yes gene_type:complete